MVSGRLSVNYHNVNMHKAIFWIFKLHKLFKTNSYGKQFCNNNRIAR